MLYGIMLVRNESGRYLEKVLEQMRTVCDKIIVLDDASTDDTVEICLRYISECREGFKIHISEQSLWETDELRQRKLLWDMACDCAKQGDWILCLDADETIANIDQLPRMIAIVEATSNRYDSIAFPLYDMWDETHYRDDELWNAHSRPWVMCVRYDPDREYIWRETPLHCGRFPLNAAEYAAITNLKIQHWGWSRENDRIEKYNRYMRSDPEGKSGSLFQYASILDKDPVLKEFMP